MRIHEFHLISSLSLIITIICSSTVEAGGLSDLDRRQIAIARAAADQRKPSRPQVDIIEKLISRRRCVETISQWNRRYSFGVNNNTGLNTDQIDFNLTQNRLHKGSIEILRFKDRPQISHGRYKFVYGSYSIRRQKMTISFCEAGAHPNN